MKLLCELCWAFLWLLWKKIDFWLQNSCASLWLMKPIHNMKFLKKWNMSKFMLGIWWETNMVWWSASWFTPLYCICKLRGPIKYYSTKTLSQSKKRVLYFSYSQKGGNVMKISQALFFILFLSTFYMRDHMDKYKLFPEM